MNEARNAIRTWQGWLDAFVLDASTESLAAHIQSQGDEIPVETWMALFQLRTLYDEANAMLLACLQGPAPEAEQALAAIAAAARGVRFARTPRQMKGRLKEVYRRATKALLRDYPPEADLLQSIFLHYLHDDYDAQSDANLLLQEARLESARNQRAHALELAGRAGAAVLRGRPLWAGWESEGEGEFPQWALLLLTLFGEWGAHGLLPLGAAAAERGRAGERADLLVREYTRQYEEPHPEDVSEDDAELDERFVDGWIELANRERPLDEGELQNLGELYGRYAEMAMRTLEVSSLSPDALPDDSLVRAAAATIGVLRYANRYSIALLISVVRDSQGIFGDETLEYALWSLEQLGTAALPAVFDFVRYSSDDGTRGALMEVLGVVGRGSPEVFDYVSGQFLGLSWESGKIEYAHPLALLHDLRAAPMLCDALSDPAVYADDAWELLDALEELGVAFSVDRATRVVSIPEYGVIEGVLPEDWFPRAEVEALKAVDLEEDEPGSSAWERSEDDGIVFDAFGIAHCADCGSIMHRANGRWEHPYVDEFPAPQKAPRAEAIGHNDPCPCGSGKKYKYCHGRPTSARLN